MKATLRHIYLCRTANMSWRTCVVVKQIQSNQPPGWHHCGHTLTIDHMLLECALLRECRDEYYTIDSLNALFETIPETCIVEFLWEPGFFYLIWRNLLTSTSPDTWTIWSDLSYLFREEKNLCRSVNMSWRTCVVVKQIQSNQPRPPHQSFTKWFRLILFRYRRHGRD